MAAIPRNPISLFYPLYSFSGRKRLSDDDLRPYNILVLFGSEPNGNVVVDNIGNGGDGTGMFWYSYPDNADITGSSAADIATCTARGQRVIAAIGGASAQIRFAGRPGLTAKQVADNIYDDIVAYNNALAGSDTGSTPYISGVLWNCWETMVPEADWMTYVSLRLKTKYGRDFIISAAPAASTAALPDDREAMATMFQGNTVLSYAASPYFYAGSYVGPAMSWFCAQHYDSASLTDQSLVLTRLGTTSSGFKFPVTINGASVQIPSSIMGIGFSIGVGTNNWTAQEAADCYDAAVAAGTEVKGAWNFDDIEDSTHSFATVVGPKIINSSGISGPLPPSFVL